MATNDPGSGDSDKSRGTGADKETVVEPDGPEAERGTFENEPTDSNDPARGGCMKMGWGCLSMAAFLLVAPAGILFHF